jgi:hypothetical protein
MRRAWGEAHPDKDLRAIAEAMAAAHAELECAWAEHQPAETIARREAGYRAGGRPSLGLPAGFRITAAGCAWLGLAAHPAAAA